jgi:branched-chain amino acid transport system permease protein
MSGAAPAVAAMLRSHRPRWFEALPWLTIVAAYFAFEGFRPFGAQIMIMVLFALSLDLILGYAGIVTLGHAAFFGVGAYAAGLLAVAGWREPLTGLLVAGAAAGLVGLATGVVILRTRGLTLLMLTLAVVFMLEEAANKASWITGGTDGLQLQIDPVFGAWRFDMFGRTAYVYVAVVLFLGWVFARRLVHSPFGRTLTGIRENVVRMHAIGAPVNRRLIVVYAISAAMAGVAGALLAQTTKFVGLNMISFELSGAVLIMLVFGGAGRLYGAFVGAPVYMLAQDALAKIEPTYWQFGLGLLLVLVVLFARGGLLGLLDRARAKFGGKPS